MKRIKSSVKFILISVVSVVCIAAIVLGCVLGIKRPNTNEPGDPNNPSVNIHEGLSKDQINLGNLVQEANTKSDYLKEFDSSHIVDDNGVAVNVENVKKYYDIGFSIYLDINKTKEMFYVYPKNADENNYKTINIKTLVGKIFGEDVGGKEFEYATDLRVLENKITFIAHSNNEAKLIYLELSEDNLVKDKKIFEISKLGENLFFVYNNTNYHFGNYILLKDTIYLLTDEYSGDEDNLNNIDIFAYRINEDIFDIYHTSLDNTNEKEIYFDSNENSIYFTYGSKLHIESFYDGIRKEFDYDLKFNVDYSFYLNKVGLYIEESIERNNITNENTVILVDGYYDFEYKFLSYKTNEIKDIKLDTGYVYATFMETADDLGFLCLTERKIDVNHNIIANDNSLIYFDEDLNKIISIKQSSNEVIQLKGFYGNKFLTTAGIYTVKDSKEATCIFEFRNSERDYSLFTSLNNQTFALKSSEVKLYIMNLNGELVYEEGFERIVSYENGIYLAKGTESYYLLNVNDETKKEITNFAIDEQGINESMAFEGHGMYLIVEDNLTYSLCNYKGDKILENITKYKFESQNNNSYLTVAKDNEELTFFNSKSFYIAESTTLSQEEQNYYYQLAYGENVNTFDRVLSSAPTSFPANEYYEKLSGNKWSISYYGCTIASGGGTVSLTMRVGYRPAGGNKSNYFRLDSAWNQMDQRIHFHYYVSNNQLYCSVDNDENSNWGSRSYEYALLGDESNGYYIVVKMKGLRDRAFASGYWNEICYDRTYRYYEVHQPTNSTYSSSQTYNSTYIANGYIYYANYISNNNVNIYYSTAPKTLTGGKYYGIYYLDTKTTSIGKLRDYTIASDGKSFGFSISNSKKTFFYNGSNSSVVKLNYTRHFYVTYEPATYTVQYSGVNRSDTTATFNTAFNVTAPSRTGYTFNGWYVYGMDSTTHYYGSTSSTSSSSSSTNFNVTSSTTYFKNLRGSSGTVRMAARWIPNTYNISYSLNGGGGVEGSQPSDQIYNEGNYGFVYNNRGYYESQNTYVDSSYSIAKVSFTTTSSNQSVYFYCINYGETDYDFGLLSNLDTTLSASNTADTSNVYKSFKGSSSTSRVTVSYNVPNAGTHFIYIKYRKDGSSTSYYDSFQFYSNLTLTVSNELASGTQSVAKAGGRIGYDFTGWTFSGMDNTTHYYGSTSSATSTTSSTSITINSVNYIYFRNLRSTSGTVTFTAQWSPKSYSLSINPNGGNYNGSSSTTSYTQNYNTTKTIYNPTRTGYTFNGWQMSNTDTTYGGRLNNLCLTPDNSVINITSTSSLKPHIYNNNNNGAVTHNIISDSSSSSGYSLKITTNGSASPGAGGFRTSVSVDASSVYYHCFTAKLPVGCTLHPQRNYIGDGAYYTWLTPNVGTGDWETYSYIWHTGTGSGFSSYGIGYINVEAPNNTSVTWYLRESLVYKQASSSTYTYGAGSNSLKAIWSINYYDLTINPNGGVYNGTSSNTIINQKYNSTCSIGTPTRTGYTFAGWSVSGSGSLSGSTFTYGAGNATLTATWNPNPYYITLIDRGDIVGGITEYYNTYWSPSSITIPTRNDGYVFRGYYTGENGTGDMIISPDGNVSGSTSYFLEDSNIYLYWYDNAPPVIERTYTVQDDNIGFWIYAYIYDNVEIVSANINVYTKADSNDDLMTYTLEHLDEPYVFNNQYYNYKCYVSTSNHNYEIGTYIILFDVRDPNDNISDPSQVSFSFEFIITIDKQEGTGGSDSFKIIYSEGFMPETIEKPSRHGYRFMGCYTEPEGNGEMIINMEGKAVGSNTFATYHQTVYVRWVEAPYFIMYDLNPDIDIASTTGKFANPDEVTYEIKREVLLYVPDPVRIGYKFIGWKISNMNDELPHYYYRNDIEFTFYSTNGIFINSGSANNITIQASTFKSLQSGDETVLFTAVWEPVSFNVNYHYLPAEFNGLSNFNAINIVGNMTESVSDNIIYDKYFTSLNGAYNIDSLTGAYVPSELVLVGWYFVDHELGADIYIDDFAKNPELYMSYCEAGMEHLFDFYRDHNGSDYFGETKWAVGNIHAYAVYRPVDITIKIKVVKQGGRPNNINDYEDLVLEKDIVVRLGDKITLPTAADLGRGNIVGFMIAYDNYEGGELTGDGSITSVTKFTYDGVEYEAKCGNEIRWGYPGSSAHNDPRNPVYYLYAVYAS